MKSWADSIISRVCNEHRNSDLRAANPAVINALNVAHAAEVGEVWRLLHALWRVTPDYSAEAKAYAEAEIALRIKGLE